MFGLHHLLREISNGVCLLLGAGQVDVYFDFDFLLKTASGNEACEFAEDETKQ